MAVGLLTTTHAVTFHSNPAEQLLVPSQWLQLPLAMLSLAILAPLTEEIYFRGLLLSWIDNKLCRIAAVVLSGAAFGLFHFRFNSHAGIEGWFLTAMLALFGMMNALWVVRTRSLWPGIVAHGFYNGMLIVLPLLAAHH